MDLSVKIVGHEFKTPLLPASGPLTSKYENIMFFDKSKVGGLVTKTISVEAADVKKPCIYGDKNIVYNSELWSEDDLEYWVSEILPKVSDEKTKPLIVSTGYNAEELSITIPQLDRFADIFEISTHYVKEDIQKLVTTIKSETDKPVFIKLSPHIQDYLGFIRKVIDAGADGIAAINSVGPAIKVDIENRKILLGNEKGETWISGPAIKPIALQRVRSIRNEFPDIPLIAVGGVSSSTDIIEFLLAGADLVQMLSEGLIRGKKRYDEIISNLEDDLKKYEFNSITEVRQTNLKKNEFKTNNFPEIDYEKCIDCKLCIEVCPEFAISYDKKVIFNHDKCMRCGLCESRCPTKAIKGVL